MIEGRNFRLKRIPAALRGSGGGDIDPVQAALNRFDFHAPLTKSVLLSRGVGAASYTRATVATVKDFEGNIRNCLSGEVRFEGQRRVGNLVATTSDDFSNAAWTKGALGAGVTAVVTADYAAAPDGTTTADRLQLSLGGANTINDMSYLAGTYAGYTSGRTYAFSVWMKSNTTASPLLALYNFNTQSNLYTVTPTWQRFVWTVTPGSTASSTFGIRLRGGQGMTDPADISIWHPQLEDITGQSNQNPSEYVSVGAAKLNMLLQTEAYTTSPWTSSLSTIAQNGTLGGVVAWDISDASAVAYSNTAQTITVPNDSTTYTATIRVKKTSGGTAPVFGVNLGLTGGVTVSHTPRLNTDTGTSAYGPAFSVQDGGAYWVLVATVTNNSSGNTTLSITIYPATAAAGGVADSVAAQGTQTVCAPCIVSGSSVGTYFPVGNVYPYHGAMVDGVKYFDTENGNTVTSNVVTEAVGRSLEGYSVAQLPGTVGAYFSTPNAAANRVTGDGAWVWVGYVPDYTPAGSMMLLAKGNVGGTQRAYLFQLLTSGLLQFGMSTDGLLTSQLTVSSSVVPTTSPEAIVGFAVTRDKATGTVTFWTSADAGVTWTQLGTTSVLYAGVDIFPSSSDVEVGSYATGSSNNLQGGTLYAKIFNTTAFTTAQPVVTFNPREGWTENLLVQSEDFNTTWGKAQITVSTNAIANPVDGAVTADKIVETAVNNIHELTQSFTVSTTDAYELSVYAKAAERTWIALWLDGTAKGAYFDLTNGVAGTTSAGVTTSIQPAGNGWYRCKITLTPTAAASNFGIYIASADNVASYLGDITKGVYLFGAKFRRVAVAGQRTSSQYLPTTSAALRGWISSTGEQWTINGAATVLQRQAEGYLPEGASTNLVLYSSDFTNWTAGGTPTITSAARRVGDITLDLIGDDNAAGLEYYTRTITFTADAQKSVSIIVAQGSSTASYINLQDNTAVAQRLQVDLTWSNGLPVCVFTTGSQERPPEALGNGAFRLFFLTSSVTAANSNAIYIYPATTSAGSGAPTGTLYAGGVQAENATVASSLQPTTTATVARNADVLTFPGAGNVSQTTGSLYAEASPNRSTGANHVLVNLDNGAVNDRILLYRNTSNSFIYDVTTGGVAQVNATVGTALNYQLHKLAGRYLANDFAASINGATVVTDVAGSVPAVTTISVGCQVGLSQFGSPMKNLRIARVTLSNQELTLVTR